MTLWRRTIGRTSALTAALLVDAAFEFAVGGALLAWSGNFAEWWAIGETGVIVLGALFVLTGAALVAMTVARLPADQVRGLALANVAGGALGWALLLAAYGRMEPEGRWLLAAFADCFIAIGAAEWLIAKRPRP